MKKWARGLVVCAAAAVLSIGAACMAYAAEGEINVNGTGVVQADPDTADISLEISTDANILKLFHSILIFRKLILCCSII